MLKKVKDFLRISHTSQDSLINDFILSAEADLNRLGVDVDEDDPLVVSAIIVYVAKEYTKSTDECERYTMSYQTRVDELRKRAKDGTN